MFVLQPSLGTCESRAGRGAVSFWVRKGDSFSEPFFCEVQGTRSQIWAGNWAQNPVPKIRLSSGPAGWDKVCASGVVRLLCQAKARVTVGMVLRTQARLVLCAVFCPSQMVWSLCKRAPFSRPNRATEAMTPPICSFSCRLHGFCIPCGQPCAETFEF